jgi:hypothetical protein
MSSCSINRTACATGVSGFTATTLCVITSAAFIADLLLADRRVMIGGQRRLDPHQTFRREHIECGCYLMRTEDGRMRIKAIIREDVAAAWAASPRGAVGRLTQINAEMLRRRQVLS